MTIYYYIHDIYDYDTDKCIVSKHGFANRETALQDMLSEALDYIAAHAMEKISISRTEDSIDVYLADKGLDNVWALHTMEVFYSTTHE